MKKFLQIVAILLVVAVAITTAYFTVIVIITDFEFGKMILAVGGYTCVIALTLLTFNPWCLGEVDSNFVVFHRFMGV